MHWTSRFITQQAVYYRAVALCVLLLCLLLTNNQVGSLFGKQAPGAGSRATRSSYHLIQCTDEENNSTHWVTPLPESRYVYSEQYGWFDETHFEAGNPGQILADVKTATSADGGIISISQSVRDGLTGYTAHYLVSGDVSPEEVTETALGIYMDWSIRFEQWQGSLPRNLVGPFTPFAIEDLPTQYIGFVEGVTGMERADLFACYLGQVETAKAPPHLWVDKTTHMPNGSLALPQLHRLTNKTFQPLILTADGWEHVNWPVPLRLNPIPSSNTTWVFDSEETWYLQQRIP